MGWVWLNNILPYPYPQISMSPYGLIREDNFSEGIRFSWKEYTQKQIVIEGTIDL